MSLVFKPVPSPMLFTIVPMIAQAKIWTLTIPSPQSPFIFLLHFKPYKAKIMPFFFLSFFFGCVPVPGIVLVFGTLWWVRELSLNLSLLWKHFWWIYKIKWNSKVYMARSTQEYIFFSLNIYRDESECNRNY